MAGEVVYRHVIGAVCMRTGSARQRRCVAWPTPAAPAQQQRASLRACGVALVCERPTDLLRQILLTRVGKGATYTHTC